MAMAYLGSSQDLEQMYRLSEAHLQQLKLHEYSEYNRKRDD